MDDQRAFSMEEVVVDVLWIFNAIVFSDLRITQDPPTHWEKTFEGVFVCICLYKMYIRIDLVPFYK